MSETWSQHDSGGVAGEAPVPDGVTAGAMLRGAREAAGLHVAALAVSLKVTVSKLEALEADRYDLLPDLVFARALASSVCRTLKIDPQPVLERLPRTPAPRLVPDSDGINAPFRAPGDGAAPTWLDQLTRPVFMAVFALLLGALVLVLLPTAQQPDSPAPGAGTELAGAPALATAAAPTAPPAAPAETVTTVVSAAVGAIAAPATPAAPGVSAALPAAPPASAAAAPAATVPASGIIVFRAKGPSWVEVTDAQGVVALRKLLAAGEAGAASGALPLQVTIGRVDFTEVQVRGKAFDLAPVSRDNVARFEVK